MEKVGNNDVIYSKSLIIPSGESAEILHNHMGWNLKIKLVFITEQDGGSSTSIKGLGDHAEVTFKNWNDSLGVSLAEPIYLGTHENGDVLYFHAVGHDIGGVKQITFQITVGE